LLTQLWPCRRRRIADRLRHEIAPNARRQTAAVDAAQRGVVIIANPDTDDQVTRKSDE
jgi:hypothetical protein